MLISAYDKLAAQFRRYNHLSRVLQLLDWDKEVLMPAGAAEGRSADMAELSLMMHELLSDDRLTDWLQEAEGADPWQAANLREMQRMVSRARAVPADLAHHFAETASACSMMWVNAKQQSDYTLVLPLFEKMLPLLREKLDAEAAALDIARYDAALDAFDPAMRHAFIDPIFKRLAQELPPLAQAIIEKQQQASPAQPWQGDFSAPRQKQLTQDLLARMGYDFHYGRLDKSEHPFSAGPADDSRITGRFDEADPLWGLAAYMHEAGHAMYEQGIPAPWRSQPVGSARGMALHESQSLFWEKQVGQSAAFFRYISPIMRHTYGDFACYGAENLWNVANKVASTYIRFEADEATYPLHIIMRFELEQALLSGNLAARDLRGAWAEKLKAYLNLPYLDDKRGCVQDPHWFSGDIGYFPDYSLGAMIAAQTAAAMRQELDLDGLIEQGNFAPILAWQRTHVQQKASAYSTEAIITQSTGTPLSPDAFMAYLKGKYAV